MLAGQNLHARVSELGNVKKRPVTSLCAQCFVRRTCESEWTKCPEQHTSVFIGSKPHETIGDEPIGHHVPESIPDALFACVRIGGEALPALLGIDHEKSTREGVLIEIAPHRY